MGMVSPLGGYLLAPSVCLVALNTRFFTSTTGSMVEDVGSVWSRFCLAYHSVGG